jgi:hypothetical protein
MGGGQVLGTGGLDMYKRRGGFGCGHVDRDAFRLGSRQAHSVPAGSEVDLRKATEFVQYPSLDKNMFSTYDVCTGLRCMRFQIYRPEEWLHTDDIQYVKS